MTAHPAAPGTPSRADQLRRQVADRNTAAILDATLAHLERDPRPSMAAIARAAGVSRVTLYAHFPTREDLVEAAMQRALAEAQRDIAAAGIEYGPASQALQRLITAGWAPLADPFWRLITRGQQAGEFRDDQPAEWMVTVLYALLHAAAGEVASGRLDPRSAAELIAGSALGAFQPHHSTPTTTT